jgi:hypothetical protein
MSMKIFTLSAVCVLVYSLMIALSGTTGFPGYSEERIFPRPDDGNQQQVAAVFNHDLSGSGSGSALPSIQDWNRSNKEFRRTDFEEGEETNGINRPIRLFGIMFILVWILVSVKLLFLD